MEIRGKSVPGKVKWIQDGKKFDVLAEHKKECDSSSENILERDMRRGPRSKH